jgi:hypothetical protein
MPVLSDRLSKHDAMLSPLSLSLPDRLTLCVKHSLHTLAYLVA